MPETIGQQAVTPATPANAPAPIPTPATALDLSTASAEDRANAEKWQTSLQRRGTELNARETAIAQKEAEIQNREAERAAEEETQKQIFLSAVFGDEQVRGQMKSKLAEALGDDLPAEYRAMVGQPANTLPGTTPRNDPIAKEIAEMKKQLQQAIEDSKRANFQHAKNQFDQDWSVIQKDYPDVDAVNVERAKSNWLNGKFSQGQLGMREALAAEQQLEQAIASRRAQANTAVLSAAGGAPKAGFGQIAQVPRPSAEDMVKNPNLLSQHFQSVLREELAKTNA